MLPVLRIDHLLRLAAEALLQDRNRPGLVEQRLEDLVFVGVDGALDDVLAQAPGAVDQHDLVEASLRVDRKHHPRPRQVRADHLLNAD